MNFKPLALSMLITFLFLSLGFSSQAQGSWELKKNKNGVSVYTKKVENSKLKAYKAIVEINSTVEEAYDLLLDFKAYPAWQHNCSTGKLIKKVNDNSMYVYVVTDAPWPVSDRDIVMKYDITKPSSDEIKIGMSAGDKSMAPAVKGNVRMDYLKGFWKITSKGEGKIQITQQVHADPAGNIPEWLANSAVVDTPYETLLKMKQRLEK